MEKLSVLNTKGESVSKTSLNPEVWGIEPNDAVLYDAIMLTRSSLRQGTADTKTRSEVSGGGIKPWKQKGTGRARQGSIRAPHWIHGGVVFGPHPRSYAKKMNKKERRLALKSALAYKVLSNELIILDDLKLESNKTKDMKNLLATLKLERNVLIVVDELTESLVLASRNLNGIILLQANELNTYDVVSADKMIITEKALKQVEEALI